MTAQAPDKPRKTGIKRRISARVKAAIAFRVKEGMTIDDAARAAGLSPSGFYKARLRPDVQAYEENEKAKYIQEVEWLRAPHKARAFEVARELMENSKSDTVKARMVEFLAGESRQASVNVQVNNHVSTGKGYEFLPPDAEVIDIRASDAEPNQDAGAGDSQSPASPEDSQE